MPPLSDLLGPAGLTVALIAAVLFLGRDHLRADRDDRIQRDTAFDIARAQTAATNAVSEDVEAVATALDELQKAVSQIAKEVAAIRRDMAVRRRNNQ